MNFIRIGFIILVVSINLGVTAQGWRRIDQSAFNVVYKLPNQWEVDAFGAGFGDWDKGGSSVCDCAGTINYGFNRALGMVIYPFEKAANMAKRNFVWDYKFVESTAKVMFKSKALHFEKQVSKWDLTKGTDEYKKMLDDEVWKFTFKGSRYGLVIYFWGDRDLMEKNSSTIQKILDSIMVLQL